MTSDIHHDPQNTAWSMIFAIGRILLPFWIPHIKGEIGEGLLVLKADALVKMDSSVVIPPHANLGLGCAPLLKFAECGEE